MISTCKYHGPYNGEHTPCCIHQAMINNKNPIPTNEELDYLERRLKEVENDKERVVLRIDTDLLGQLVFAARTLNVLYPVG